MGKTGKKSHDPTLNNTGDAIITKLIITNLKLAGIPAMLGTYSGRWEHPRAGLGSQAHQLNVKSVPRKH